MLSCVDRAATLLGNLHPAVFAHVQSRVANCFGPSAVGVHLRVGNGSNPKHVPLILIPSSASRSQPQFEWTLTLTVTLVLTAPSTLLTVTLLSTIFHRAWCCGDTGVFWRSRIASVMLNLYLVLALTLTVRDAEMRTKELTTSRIFLSCFSP